MAFKKEKHWSKTIFRPGIPNTVHWNLPRVHAEFRWIQPWPNTSCEVKWSYFGRALMPSYLGKHPPKAAVLSFLLFLNEYTLGSPFWLSYKCK